MLSIAHSKTEIFRVVEYVTMVTDPGFWYSTFPQLCVFTGPTFYPSGVQLSSLSVSCQVHTITRSPTQPDDPASQSLLFSLSVLSLLHEFTQTHTHTLCMTLLSAISLCFPTLSTRSTTQSAAAH